MISFFWCSSKKRYIAITGKDYGPPYTLYFCTEKAIKREHERGFSSLEHVKKLVSGYPGNTMELKKPGPWSWETRAGLPRKKGISRQLSTQKGTFVWLWNI